MRRVHQLVPPQLSLHRSNHLFVQQDSQQEPRRVGRSTLEEGIEQDRRDGLPFGAFLQGTKDVPQRDPLLREEAASGVAVDAQVDFAVRHAPDVIRQPGTPDRVSQVPVDRTRIVSSSSSVFVIGVSPLCWLKDCLSGCEGGEIQWVIQK